MASPFRIFRKNVKPLLVVFGCLLILAWVGGSSLTTLMSGPRGGAPADPSLSAGAVAASWQGGSITNQQLESLVVRRAIVRSFLDQVEGLGAQSAYSAGLQPPPLRVMPLRLPENAQEGVERSVVQTKMFADAAREAGMAVDDNAIVQYLVELGRGRVTTNDMRAILTRYQANNPGVSSNYVFDGLRDELLARNYLMSNMFAAQTVTPQQRWQDWRQVNDRAIVEVAALPVESYLVEVKDPSDAELQKFFDEYKDVEPGPDRVGDLELPSPRPGFRTPRKIAVQYVQANFNDLVTKTEAEITDEEIAKYYEDNKALFIKADTGLLNDTPAVEEAPKMEVPPAETAPSGETDAGKSNAAEADSKANDASGTDAATPTDGAAPADEATSETSPEPAPPATPAEPPGNEGTTEPPAAPGEADQSRTEDVRHQTVFRQVAFLQEQQGDSSTVEKGSSVDESAAAGEAAAPPKETAPAEEAAPAEQATPPAAEPAADATTEPPASTAPATTTETPAATEAATAPATAEAPNAAPPATEKPKTAEKPPEYQPLDEVRDVIRTQLATTRAEGKMRATMDEVQTDLTREFEAYFDKVLSSQADKAEPPAPQPALTDLAPLAAKYGLTAGKTEPMTWLEFRETPLGKSIEADSNMELFRILYGRNDKALYQPIVAVNPSDRYMYVLMKTSDTPSRVPKLSDPGERDKVARAWKLREAAKIALKDAEKQAAEAQKSGTSLVDFYAEKPAVHVEKIDPFSYLTRGDVPDRYDMQQRFRLSQPDGLVAAGPELLQRVFELKDGEVAAALNHDHSIAYVIRLVEHQDSPEELRTAYLSEANSWDGLPAMTDRHVAQSRDAIVAEVAGASGVDWKRDPDKAREDADVDASR